MKSNKNHSEIREWLTIYGYIKRIGLTRLTKQTVEFHENRIRETQEQSNGLLLHLKTLSK